MATVCTLPRCLESSSKLGSAKIWQQCADLGEAVLRRWIEQLSLADPLAEESLKLKVQAMKSEFAGPSPTALETLLVDRIVVCWLQLQQIDGLATQIDGLPPKAGVLIIARQKHANKQFLAAIQTLAIVRRLQSNLIGQQTQAEVT